MNIDIEMVKQLLTLWIKERENALLEGEVPGHQKKEEYRKLSNAKRALSLLKDEERDSRAERPMDIRNENA